MRKTGVCHLGDKGISLSSFCNGLSMRELSLKLRDLEWTRLFTFASEDSLAKTGRPVAPTNLTWVPAGTQSRPYGTLAATSGATQHGPSLSKS
eukprot:3987937-Amphidinium_carterae.1